MELDTVVCGQPGWSEHECWLNYAWVITGSEKLWVVLRHCWLIIFWIGPLLEALQQRDSTWAISEIIYWFMRAPYAVQWIRRREKGKAVTCRRSATSKQWGECVQTHALSIHSSPHSARTDTLRLTSYLWNEVKLSLPNWYSCHCQVDTVR